MEKALRSALACSSNNIIGLFTRNLPSHEESLVSLRLQSLLHHNVGNGKLNRAKMVLNLHNAVNPSNMNSPSILRAAASIEILQSFLLVADDIMDESQTRRGHICWHRMPGIGLSAINDSFLLLLASQNEIAQSFKNHPNEKVAIEAFSDAVQKTTIGQLLDTATSKKVDDFSWQRYEQLVEYKTSHYSFVLPLRIGVLGGGMRDGLDDIVNIALRIGYLFQCQDDWLDVYGKSSITGKIGSDIREGKCTWLSCKALQLMEKKGNKELDRFKKLYGECNDEDGVREIYHILKLSHQFKQFEKEYSSNLIYDIKQLSNKNISAVLHDLVNDIVQRQK